MPEKRPHWWTRPEWWLAIFAVLSFIVLWIQLKDARAAFRKDQRPYVWVANDAKDEPGIFASPITNPKGTKQIAATMRYTNWGKSPAILIQSYHAMVLGTESVEPKPWNKSRRILPTGKVDFFSGVSNELSDQEIASYWNAAEDGKGITIYATWQYSDSSGNKYETDICMTRLNLGSWQYCETHNNIKDCSEDTCEP
jgi:hypothetical protein